MVLITIVTGAYKPTYNWGASHCMYFLRNWNSQLAGLDLTVPASRWYLHIFPSNLGFYPGKRVWHDSSVWGESRAGLLHCTSCWPLGSFKLFVLVSCSFVTYSWTLCLFIYLSIFMYICMVECMIGFNECTDFLWLWQLHPSLFHLIISRGFDCSCKLHQGAVAWGSSSLERRML